MSISKQARAGIVAGAAIAAVSLAGIGVAASANAADSTTTSPSSSPSTASTRPAHVQEEALTGATADSVKAAVLAKYPGATVNKLTKDSDEGAAYEAHITKADGTRAKVLLDANFTVTAEKAPHSGKGPDGKGAPGQGHRGLHRGQDGTQPNGAGDNQGKHLGQHHGEHGGQHGAPAPTASASPNA